MIGSQFGTAFKFLLLARYDCLHEIPRLKQVMPTALIQYQCMESTDWV
jgi:hypothetical protein